MDLLLSYSLKYSGKLKGLIHLSEIIEYYKNAPQMLKSIVQKNNYFSKIKSATQQQFCPGTMLYERYWAAGIS